MLLRGAGWCPSGGTVSVTTGTGYGFERGLRPDAHEGAGGPLAGLVAFVERQSVLRGMPAFTVEVAPLRHFHKALLAEFCDGPPGGVLRAADPLGGISR